MAWVGILMVDELLGVVLNWVFWSRTGGKAQAVTGVEASYEAYKEFITECELSNSRTMTESIKSLQTQATAQVHAWSTLTAEARPPSHPLNGNPTPLDRIRLSS